MNIVPAPTSTSTDTSIKDLMDGFLKSNTPLKKSFSPQLMTIAPPLLPVEDEVECLKSRIFFIFNLPLLQLIWFDFTNPAWHKPIYDTTICDPANVSSEAKRLMALAFNEALNIQDRQLLISELEKDPNMVYHIGLTPAKVTAKLFK